MRAKEWYERMNDEYIGGMKGTFGVMFDYAVNYCSLDGDEFLDMMICSGVAKQIECTNPKYAAGKSGIELVRDIADEIGYDLRENRNRISTDSRSADYWCGWVLIQYQNYSRLSFKQIHRLIEYKDLYQMYSKYHEMDITKLYDYLDGLQYTGKNVLKKQRELAGMSQSELAGKSGTSLRTLQAYEQGVKDIRKAQVETVIKLAKGVGCEIDDII